MARSPATLLGASDSQHPRQIPKSVQGKAKQLIHEMYLAATRTGLRMRGDMGTMRYLLSCGTFFN
jgi:hypothetical protein